MSWRKVSAIAKKDLTHYFSSPMGYVVLAVFFLVTGFFFYLIAGKARMASMTPVFQNAIILLLFLTPMITMRLWSEEEKSGTAELLKTSPISTWEVVLGKYLAVCAFGGVMLSVTLVYLLIMVEYGNPDMGPVLTCYIGFILGVMAYFSLGLLASTFSENQIISAVIAYGLLLMLWVIGAAGNNANGPIAKLLKYLSFFSHTSDFFNGVINSTHIVYFVSLIVAGLFFSVKVLESKRS
jgi:ABC-2 type transport system permease protein